MAGKAKRSEVLEYFTEIGDHKVKSKICQAKLSYQSNTSTMRQHMLLKHNGEFGKADPQQPSVGYFHRRKMQLQYIRPIPAADALHSKNRFD